MHKWVRPTIILGLTIIAGLCVLGLDPKLVTHFTPFQEDKFHKLTYSAPPFPPSKLHPFGTDGRGHDILAQILYGILPTLRVATILVILTIAIAVGVAVIQTLYHVRVTIFDRIAFLTSIMPPVLIALLMLEAQPIYFSKYSPYWYLAVIGLLEIGRLIPVVEGDIRLIYQKKFIEGAVVSGASQFWIFRKHVIPWIWPYLIEYIPSQYARVLTVIGELAYFGVLTKVQIVMGMDGPIFTTKETNLPALISLGAHHWFTVPGGVLFPTVTLSLMVVAFRLISTGASRASQMERSQYWPWREPKRWWKFGGLQSSRNTAVTVD